MQRILLKTVALITIAMAAGSAAAQDKTTLKIATFTPAGTFVVKQLFEPLLDKVVAESEGTLDYKIFAGGTLGRNPAEQLSLVQNGIADMAYVVPSYINGVYEGYNVAQLPLVTDNSEETAAGLWNAFEKGLIQTPDGVHMISVFANGQNGLHLAADVKSATDIEGRKIRVGGQIQEDTIQALNAIPVGNLPAPSVAESLSRGVVDGAFMDWGAIQSFRVDKVTSAHIDFPFGALPVMIPMNQKTWDGLSAPAKAAFEKYGGRAFAIEMGKKFDDYGEQVKQTIRDEGGHTIVEPTEEERAELDKLVGHVVADWAGAGEGRQAILDAYREGAESLNK